MKKLSQKQKSKWQSMQELQADRRNQRFSENRHSASVQPQQTLESGGNPLDEASSAPEPQSSFCPFRFGPELPTLSLIPNPSGERTNSSSREISRSNMVGPFRYRRSLRLESRFGSMTNVSSGGSTLNELQHLTSHFPNKIAASDSGVNDRWDKSECKICFDQKIDTVLYRCGHSLMCYDCAIKVRSSGCNSVCPLCRAPIIDVIRTYKV